MCHSADGKDLGHARTIFLGLLVTCYEIRHHAYTALQYLRLRRFGGLVTAVRKAEEDKKAFSVINKKEKEEASLIYIAYQEHTNTNNNRT